jgi:Outer membrane protein beta-barrel domain
LRAQPGFSGALVLLAQQWEAGGLGGFGVTHNISVSNSAGSVTTGLKNGLALGAFGGSNDYRYFGGEASYIYRQSDLKLKGLGREVGFGGHTQFVDFRLLLHFADRQAHIRPFVAVGGGVAVYSGTGAESASQPLNSFAALTQTRETKPMVSGALGVKMRLGTHVGLRFEFRDYATPFPSRMIAIVPGASASGWLHNFMPVAGISGIF